MLSLPRPLQSKYVAGFGDALTAPALGKNLAFQNIADPFVVVEVSI